MNDCVFIKRNFQPFKWGQKRGSRAPTQMHIYTQTFLSENPAEILKTRSNYFHPEISSGVAQVEQKAKLSSSSGVCRPSLSCTDPRDRVNQDPSMHAAVGRQHCLFCCHSPAQKRDAERSHSRTTRFQLGKYFGIHSTPAVRFHDQTGFI